MKGRSITIHLPDDTPELAFRIGELSVVAQYKDDPDCTYVVIDTDSPGCCPEGVYVDMYVDGKPEGASIVVNPNDLRLFADIGEQLVSIHKQEIYTDTNKQPPSYGERK